MGKFCVGVGFVFSRPFPIWRTPQKADRPSGGAENLNGSDIERSRAKRKASFFWGGRLLACFQIFFSFAFKVCMHHLCGACILILFFLLFFLFVGFHLSWCSSCVYLCPCKKMMIYFVVFKLSWSLLPLLPCAFLPISCLFCFCFLSFFCVCASIDDM